MILKKWKSSKRAKLKRFIVVCFSLLIVQSCCTNKKISSNYELEYNKILAGSLNGSYKKIYQFITSGNGKYFISYSHFTNANNLMYKQTKDYKYLQNNLDVFKKIMYSGSIIERDSSDVLKLEWITSFENDELNHMITNQEYFLYEAYFLRYAAETLHLSKNNSFIKEDDWVAIRRFVEGIYLKWYDRSIKEFGDASFVHSIRTHMGSHFAQASLFLMENTSSNYRKVIYKRVFDDYTISLKNNLKVMGQDQPRYYWNASWDNPFTVQQINRRKLNKDINIPEDTPHANHTVEFIINSYEMNMGNWKRSDIEKLSNTWRYLFNQESKTFSDLINNKPSKERRLQNKSHKQMGWILLTKYDKLLVEEIFNPWYNNYQDVLLNSYLAGESIAQLFMIKNLEKNISN